MFVVISIGFSIVIIGIHTFAHTYTHKTEVEKS